MTNMPVTLVCFAVKQEAGRFCRLIRGRPELATLVTGMGRNNAEAAVRAALSQLQPKCVVTAGFAGGLNPDFAHGTVGFEADGAGSLAEKLRAAGARPARFHCSNEIISTAQQKQALYQKTGADVVEMESLFIQGLCRQRRIACAIVRVVLDPVDEDLPLDFNRILTKDLRIAPGKLAAHLLKAPWRVPALVRLQQRSASAAARLANVLIQALE